MDLITQGLLGAVVGQALYTKKMGTRAMLWGAIAGLLPDADMIVVQLSSHPMAMELIHRGLTHSLFFAPIAAVPLGMLFSWLDPVSKDPVSKDPLSNDSLSKNLLSQGKRSFKHLWTQATPWMALSFWALITHPLLDLFTTFGVQLLAPFSNHRFALSAVPIVDPVYSVPFIISLAVGGFFTKISLFLSRSVLFFTTVYLLLGLAQHDNALNEARRFCQNQGLASTRIEAFPMIPSIFSQRLLVETPQRIYVTEYSTWNHTSKPWIHIERESLPTNLAHNSAFKTYAWFTNDIYVIQNHNEHGVCMLDSRYGSLAHRPFGHFSLCIKNGVIQKNADYDDTLKNHPPQSPTTASVHFFSKIKKYAEILKNVWSWTFKEG